MLGGGGGVSTALNNDKRSRLIYHTEVKLVVITVNIESYTKLFKKYILVFVMK